MTKRTPADGVEICLGLSKRAYNRTTGCASDAEKKTEQGTTLSDQQGD